MPLLHETAFFISTAMTSERCLPCSQNIVDRKEFCCSAAVRKTGKHGVQCSDMITRGMFHASLDTDEYRALLEKHGFVILKHRQSDPACGGHTYWIAQKI